MQILNRGNHPRHIPPFPKLMHTGLITKGREGGRAGTLNFYAAQSRNHHLLAVYNGPIQQQKFPQLKVSFYECLQDDQLRVCLSLWCWHRQMNRKIGNEIAKLKKLRQRDQSDWGIEWQCETSGWVINLAEIWDPGEEIGDNLLTGSRNLAFWVSSRTKSASSCSSDCWETRCWRGDWRGCWCCRGASRRSSGPGWTRQTRRSLTWRWWWLGELDCNKPN